MTFKYNPFIDNLDSDSGGSTPVVPSGSFLYFGDSSTNGSWRIYVSGVNLVVEKRESGLWVEKGSFQP